VVADGVLYVAAHASGVWALDAATGQVLWRHETVGARAVAVAGERVWYTNVERPSVVALDRADGAPLWRSTFDLGAPSAPVAAAGLVFVSTTHDLYVLDGETGRFVERYAPAEGFTAPPATGGGRLFVLSNRGYLHAMEIR
jgi:outer membrane protein assembly factor BamB